MLPVQMSGPNLGKVTRKECPCFTVRSTLSVCVKKYIKDIEYKTNFALCRLYTVYEHYINWND